ncbi:hypothetical protein A5708_20130 [Mycobacterium colombiense]|uniref:Uncharacterized protein n=1 Tax=Mycobacterium colombiense TaxID=339268 RepID=A0A1A2YZY9_9MYCO|nr:hypothetical protein A5708_20130 [Mycobacterium colombiense]
MGKAFHEAEIGFCRTGRVEQRIRRDGLDRSLIQCGPTGRSAFGIKGESTRIKLVCEFHSANRAFEDAFSEIGPSIEVARCHTPDVLAEEFDQLAVHQVLPPNHQAIDDLHSGLQDLFACMSFTLHVVQYAIDVVGDLFEFIERIAFEDQYRVVNQIGQGPQPVQQIPNLVLGVVHLVREVVQGIGQLVALRAQLADDSGEQRQIVLDQLAFRYLLPGDYRLRAVERGLNTAKRRAESAPTTRGRMHSNRIAIRPHIVEQRFHHSPQQWSGDARTHDVRRIRRRDLRG